MVGRRLAQSLQLGFAHELNAVYRSICEPLDRRVKTAQDRRCFALNDHYQVNTPVHPSRRAIVGSARRDPP
jgi:hypothetical protein